MKVKLLALLILAALWAPAFAGSLTPPGTTGDFITNGGSNQFGHLTPPIPVNDGGTGTTDLGTNGAGPVFANNQPSERLDYVRYAVQQTAVNPLGLVGGVSRTSIGSLYNQSQLMYATSNGLMISPMGQGAICNALPFMDIETVNGSTTITVPNYNFTNATQGNGGDIGKGVGAQYALGGGATITSVTGLHTAIVSVPAFATATGYGVIGNDDTVALQNAIQTNAFFTGGYIVAPNNCAIRNLTFAISGNSGHGNGVSIIGGLIGAVGGNFNSPNSWDSPTWFILGSGEDNDPAFGINIANGGAIGIRGLHIWGPAFAYNGAYSNGYGAGTVCVGGDGYHGGSGFWVGSNGGSTDFAMDYMSIGQCMIGFGRSSGHTGGYIGATVAHSALAYNGVAIQGPFSDTHLNDNEIATDFFGGMNFVALGAASSGETTTASGNHIQYTGDGITVQGPAGSSSTNFNFVSNMFDAQKSCAYKFVGAWGAITVTGGQITGSGWQPGSVFGGPADAAFCFHNNSNPGGSTSVGLDIVNVDVHSNGSQGNVQKYVFDSDSAFATSQTVSVIGGSLSTGGTLAVANWQVSPPPKYEVITNDLPWYRAADSGFSINASNGVGLGTTNAVAGAVLDMSKNTTSANSSVALPIGTSAARPSSPITGMERFNSTLGNLELFYNSTWNSIVPPIPQVPTAGAISGLGLSNDLVTPNTIIDVAAGSATSDDATTMMLLSGFFTKTTGSFAVGSGNGCLDSGTVANTTWYNAFEIERTDTSVVDVLCSTSLVSPTLPSPYTKERWIGTFKTDASAHILPFKQAGGDFFWTNPTLDMSSVTIGTSAVLETLNVPPGVNAQVYGHYSFVGSGTTGLQWSSPDTTPGSPTATVPFSASPGFSGLYSTTGAGTVNANLPYLLSNTAAQVNVASTVASATVSEITDGYHLNLSSSIPLKPTINISFMNGTLPTGVTFTRASTGWYFNSSGLLVSAATNAPRFDYGTPGSSTLVGLLTEGANTNLALWSRDLTQTSVWTATTSTVALDQTGIDGGATDSSSITATANNATVCQTITPTVNVNTEFSVYLKRITGSGTVSISNNGSTYVSQSITSSWARYFNNATTTTPQICIKLATSGDEVAVDVVQYEQDTTRTSLSSPIITTSATVTRAAESVTMSATPWFNAAAGSYVYQFEANNQNALVGNFFSFGSNVYQVNINNGNFSIAGDTIFGISYNTPLFAAASYSAPGGVFTTVYNGTSKGSGSSLAGAETTAAFGGQLYSWARGFQYWPYPISTANLQVLAP